MATVTQFSTLDEVEFVKGAVGMFGEGVKEHYIPEWGHYIVPSDGDKKFYHLRFKNGNEGFNVGLMNYFIHAFPSSWPSMLAAEINAKPWFATED